MEAFQESVQLLLNSQYVHLEEYVNAQTRLRNILRQLSPRERLPLLTYYDEQQRQAAVESVYEATERVREDLQQLDGIVNNLSETDAQNIRHRLALEEHLNCCRRVVTTCFKCGNQWHALGIPVAYNQTHASENQLVALATLKASITQLRELLE